MTAGTAWTRPIRRVVAVVAVVVLAGCQPAGGPDAAQPTSPASEAEDPPVGAPVGGPPQSLPELLARGQLVAEEWQRNPVVAEVEVDLQDGRWSGARLTYLAADADRFLSLVTSGSGFSQQRPSLQTFQLQPVSSDGLEDLPPFPDNAAEPSVLVEAAAEACDLEETPSVLYVTGAPVAWDGDSWSEPPTWRATVTAGDSAGAALDVTGAGDVDCLT